MEDQLYNQNCGLSLPDSEDSNIRKNITFKILTSKDAMNKSERQHTQENILKGQSINFDRKKELQQIKKN